jgi:pentose-5-phosphate-3-epimerase
MAVITPTITTSDPHKFREQMDKISTMSEGVHLDFSDGIFAPTELLPIDEAWRSDDLITHAHVMYQKPLDVIEDIMHLEADLVILHAESDDVKKCLKLLAENGTRTGIAILPETSVVDLQELEIDELFDHILVFGGNLGYQGGDADLDQLKKVERLKDVYPDKELAWDGGVNDKNIKQIAASGISVINVGGYLKNAQYPKNAYDTLVSLVS